MNTYQLSVTIITPCYNEQDTVIRFLLSLEQELISLPYRFTIVVVNDSSTDNTLELLKKFSFSSPDISLEVINLKFNAGHQAAIYQGFLFARSLPGHHYIVMDADGEDAPSVIPKLLALKENDIVNVVRGQRHESVLFRSCYFIYKALFRLATGKQMNFGNFCLINRAVMERAIDTNFSHLAAFLSKQKCHRQYIVAAKQARLGGASKMGFRKHMQHAVRSFDEYGMLLIDFSRQDNRAQPIYDLCNNDRSEKTI
jgi:polyisoprenyl-phosphate glycosyltransferase